MFQTHIALESLGNGWSGSQWVQNRVLMGVRGWTPLMGGSGMLRHHLVSLPDPWPGFRHVPSWLTGRTHASLQVYMHKRAVTDKPSSQPSPQKDAVIPVRGLPPVTCISSDEGPKAGLQDGAGSLGAGKEVTDHFF